MSRKIKKDDFFLGSSRLLPRPSLPECRDPVASAHRHWLRTRHAATEAPALAAWCEANGWKHRAARDSNRWMFRKGSMCGIWTPSTAHLSLKADVRAKGRFLHGKAHCREQVAQALERLEAGTLGKEQA